MCAVQLHSCTFWTIPLAIIVSISCSWTSQEQQKNLFLPGTFYMTNFLSHFNLASAAYTVQNSTGTIHSVPWQLVQLGQAFLWVDKKKGSWSAKNEYLVAASSGLPGHHHVAARWERGGGRKSGTRQPCTPSAGQSSPPPGRTLASFLPAFWPVSASLPNNAAMEKREVSVQGSTTLAAAAHGYARMAQNEPDQQELSKQKRKYVQTTVFFSTLFFLSLAGRIEFRGMLLMVMYVKRRERSCGFKREDVCIALQRGVAVLVLRHNTILCKAMWADHCRHGHVVAVRHHRHHPSVRPSDSA